MSNRLVDLGFGAAGRDSAEGLAINFDGQSSLDGEKTRKGKSIHIAAFYGFRSFPRGIAVKRGVSGFFAREFDRVNGHAIGFLQKKQGTAFVHDAEGYLDILLFGFRFRGRDHGFDCGYVQVLLVWKIDGERHRQETQHDNR